MSESKESSAPSSDAPSGKARLLNAAFGVVIVLIIAILINYIFGMFNPRIDLTEDKVFTLSDGTKEILDRIDTPIAIRYYAVKDRDYVGSFYESMARNVENLLAEYKRRSGGKIKVTRFDPEPDTDDFDKAEFDGLQLGRSQQTGNEMYFGVAVECLDRKELIPFIPGRPESLLEYDISRAVARAHDGTGKKVRIMTTMQIGGGFSGMQAPPRQPWYLVQELRRDYEVEFLPAVATEIPDDTDVLVVLHPYDLGDEAQFAVDQFLLKGGKVIVTVDPNFFASRFMMQGGGGNPMMPQAGGGPRPSSNLDKLFEAWGVEYVEDKVLADTIFQTQIPSGHSPTVLSIPPEAMNEDDPVTMRLNDIFLIMPGAFEFKDKEGINRETLVQSSPKNQLVSMFDADPTQRDAVERLRNSFEPHGSSRVLVARLSGTFETAFPDGDPSAPPPVEDPEQGESGENGGEPDAGSEPGADGDDASDDAGENSESGDDGGESGDTPDDTDAPAEGSDSGDDCQDESTEADDDGDSATEGDGEEEEEEEAAPPAPPSLKKSEKDGLVLLFADSDFVHDQFSTQPMQDITGRTFLRPNNDNIALFQNALEMALGGTELINVRSRTSDRRVFTKLNEWQREAEEKFAPAIAEFEDEVKEIEDNINKVIANRTDSIEKALVDPEVQANLAKLEDSRDELDKKAKELRKEQKREFDLIQLMIKLLTTGLVPALIAAFGISLAVSRKIRTAAR